MDHPPYADSVMGAWNLSYDTLNRLTGATDTQPNNPDTNYCWGYDPYGNRTIQAGSTAAFAVASPAPSGSDPCQPASDASYDSYWAHQSASNNNQLGGTTQDPGGVFQDAAGEVQADGRNQYLYDGDGRICAVKGSTGAMTGYIYNADGQRVAKGNITAWSCNPSTNGFSTTSDYVLGPGGEQVTEMAVSGSTITWKHTNVWADGRLIATYDNSGKGLHFYQDDPLGTRRSQSDPDGHQELTCSSLPYGDALSCTGPGSDPTEQHFTGKERDAESGNDYFGARYYASTTGRFLSPDWAGGAVDVPYATFGDPQSLNLYNYMRNNPLGGVDADGHWPDWSDVGDFVAAALNAYLSDNAAGVGRVNPATNVGRLGAAVGDFGAAAQGAGETLVGTGGEVGGIALDATGVGAVVGVPANVVSAGVIAHGATTAAEGAGHLLFSKRTGDFTKSEKNAMDSKNAAENGGVNKCTNCGQEVQKVQNRAGEPTPGNQLQRHHDPPLTQRPPRTKSPDDRILCKDCHVQEHRNN